MEHAASAVGLAAFGIQLCQGLVAYYEDWKSYGSDINSTYESIASVGKTFSLLKDTLERGAVDRDRSTRVAECLKSCESSLNVLQNKLKKLQSSSIPTGLRKKAWSELQRLCYPFQTRTLKELKNTTSELQENLGIALEVVHLDLDISSHSVLTSVERDVGDISLRTTAIEDLAHRLGTQCQVTSDGVQDLLAGQQAHDFREIVEWLSPADPWTNYDEARSNLRTDSGAWLKQLNLYQRWKAAQVQHIWLNGKSGCGKSVLCSVVIEDIRKHCAEVNAGFAMFYFTFSDTAKQSYRDLLRSLVAQLCWKEPGYTRLQKAWRKSDRSVQTIDSLEQILASSVAEFNKVYVAIDGLDECPEHDEIRATVLDRIEKLTTIAQNLYLLVTSQLLPDINFSMASLGASSIDIDRDRADADICQYVESELSNNRKLKSLDLTTRDLVRDTIVQKADGSFRWAVCQLSELKQLKSTKPKHIKTALSTLPKTLDITYERMLMRIDDTVRVEALVALRWLTFALRPLTLAEIVDACVIDPSGDGNVGLDERGGLDDIVEILSGLVIVDHPDPWAYDDLCPEKSSDASSSDDEFGSSSLGRHELKDVFSDTADHEHARKRNCRIRLAHFSVKEFLLSRRICEGKAAAFALQEAREQEFLAQSSLCYLIHYCGSREYVRDPWDDRKSFPLLLYAATSWHHHASSQVLHNDSREIELLTAKQFREIWLRLDYLRCQTIAHKIGEVPFLKTASDLESALYFASSVGLAQVVRALFANSIGTITSESCGVNSLVTASALGYQKVVEVLIEYRANVNGCDVFGFSPLVAALRNRNLDIIELLLQHGAETNISAYRWCSAIQLAAKQGCEQTVHLLLENGADVNARHDEYNSTALNAAIRAGNDRVVNLLLENGADIYACGSRSGNALHEAAFRGNRNVVDMLIERGANINASGSYHGNALQAAITGNWPEIIETLLAKGADINALVGHYKADGLVTATLHGNEKTVRRLLEEGADVNLPGSFWGSALQAACDVSHRSIVEGADRRIIEILLEKGADANARGGQYGSALHAALCRKDRDMVKLLVERGAVFDCEALKEAISEAGIYEQRQLLRLRACYALAKERLPAEDSCLERLMAVCRRNEPEYSSWFSHWRGT